MNVILTEIIYSLSFKMLLPSQWHRMVIIRYKDNVTRMYSLKQLQGCCIISGTYYQSFVIHTKPLWFQVEVDKRENHDDTADEKHGCIQQLNLWILYNRSDNEEQARQHEADGYDDWHLNVSE